MSGAAPEIKAALAFTLALVLAALLTPVSARLAQRAGAVARVGERSLHRAAMPSWGGLAIYAGLLAGALVFLPLEREMTTILAGGAVIVAVGALDDAIDLKPGVKLAGQMAAALVPIAGGVAVDHITLPFIGANDLGTVGPALTLVGMVAMMNVVNFTDGADGLAAGVCTIGAATFAAIALSLDRTDAGILAAATAGACLGFLPYNFNPASVFMGDAGSNLLGYILAAIAIQGVLKTAAVVALVVPLSIMAVPILDTGFVIAKRIKYGRPVYHADTWHFHHRFVNIGFSQRKTVLYLYGWTAALSLFALALRFVPYSDHHGHFHTGWSLVLGLFALIGLAASFYLVVVLEILKLRRFSRRRMASSGGPVTEQEADAEVAQRLSTGEFQALSRD